MKVVVVAKSKRHTRIYYYFNKAFRQLGHQVFWLKYPKLKKYLGGKMANAASDLILAGFQPELLFFHGLDISPALLSRIKKRIPAVMYFDDCLTKIKKKKFEQLIRLAVQADVFYVTNRGELPIYWERGVNARFITGGCDPDAHYREPAPESLYQSDVAFIGKPTTRARVDFLRQVARNFDLKLWGSRWETTGLKSHAKHVYAKEYRKICAGSKIVLGWNVDSTIDLYFSNRTWYTLGCGGFLLTAYSPNLEELFERGKQLDWFTNTDECLKKIEFYLQHADKRKEIADAGYRLAHQKYKYTDMVERIMNNLVNSGLMSQKKSSLI